MANTSCAQLFSTTLLGKIHRANAHSAKRAGETTRGGTAWFGALGTGRCNVTPGLRFDDPPGHGANEVEIFCLFLPRVRPGVSAVLSYLVRACTRTTLRLMQLTRSMRCVAGVLSQTSSSTWVRPTLKMVASVSGLLTSTSVDDSSLVKLDDSVRPLFYATPRTSGPSLWVSQTILTRALGCLEGFDAANRLVYKQPPPRSGISVRMFIRGERRVGAKKNACGTRAAWDQLLQERVPLCRRLGPLLASALEFAGDSTAAPFR